MKHDFNPGTVVQFMPPIPKRGIGMSVLGAYILFHPYTNKAYVGSGLLYARKHRHISDLKGNKHHNRNLQQAFNTNPIIEFHIIRFTETSDEAFDLEQRYLDMFFDSGLLFNLGKDARKAGIGRVVSELERKQLSLMKINIPRSEDIKIKIRSARQQQLNDPAAAERMRIGNLKRSLQVSLDGVIYDSCRHAARGLGIDKSTVADRIANKSTYPDWKYI